MNGAFRMKVAAALSLILSFQSARAGAASVPVASTGMQWVAARSSCGLVSAADLPCEDVERLAIEIPVNSDLDCGLAPRENSVTVKYSSSQLSDALLTWSGNEVELDALNQSATEGKATGLSRMVQQPFYSMVNEVAAPLAAWQILVALAGLMAIKMIPLNVRRPAAARVRAHFRR